MTVADAMTSLDTNTRFHAALNSEDAVEGPASFAEKRQPVWRGR